MMMLRTKHSRKRPTQISASVRSPTFRSALSVPIRVLLPPAIMTPVTDSMRIVFPTTAVLLFLHCNQSIDLFDHGSVLLNDTVFRPERDHVERHCEIGKHLVP